MAAVLLLVGADCRRQRSSEILASDACESGISVCVGTFPLDAVKLEEAVEVSATQTESARVRGPLTLLRDTYSRIPEPFGSLDFLITMFLASGRLPGASC